MKKSFSGYIFCAFLLISATPAWAEIRVHQPAPSTKKSQPYHTPKPQAPPQCSDTRGNPWLGAVCSWLTQGQPQASGEWLHIPAYGSHQSKQTGFACMNGLAMRRLPDGWEQLRDKNNKFYRCQNI